MAGATTCKTCPAGTFSSTQSPTCTLCPVGKYQPSSNSDACIACTAGKFQEAQGFTTCQDCPSGRAQAYTGADKCNECQVLIHLIFVLCGPLVLLTLKHTKMSLAWSVCGRIRLIELHKLQCRQVPRGTGRHHLRQLPSWTRSV